MKKLKSKIATLAIALCTAVPCMFALTACGVSHTHTLTKVDAVAETCTTDGNTHYYKCDCGKYFSDEKAETEIKKDSWIIAKTGHSFEDTWTYNETHHWKEANCSHSTEKGNYAEHTLNNNECDCGYKKIIYTVADVNAWNEVFTGDYLTNGTVDVDGKTYTNGVLAPEQSVTNIMKSTAESMYMTYTYEGEQQAQYLVKENGTWYGLTEYEGTWYGAEQTDAEVEIFTFAGGQGIYFVNKFDEFEYDEVNHCYVANDFTIDDETAEYVKIYIENGKIMKMEIKESINAETYTESVYVFSNYGTTTIDNIPEWQPAPQM